MVSRKDAAKNVAADNLDHLMLPGADKDKAGQLVEHLLDGKPVPDGVTQHIRERAEDAAKEGVEHVYGDKVPDDIRRRLNG